MLSVCTKTASSAPRRKPGRCAAAALAGADSAVTPDTAVAWRQAARRRLEVRMRSLPSDGAFAHLQSPQQAARYSRARWTWGRKGVEHGRKAYRNLLAASPFSALVAVGRHTVGLLEHPGRDS